MIHSSVLSPFLLIPESTDTCCDYDSQQNLTFPFLSTCNSISVRVKFMSQQVIVLTSTPHEVHMRFISLLVWTVPVYSAIRPGCLLSAAPPTLMLLHKYGALMQNHNCNLFIPLPSMTSSNESYIFIHQDISYIPLF